MEFTVRSAHAGDLDWLVGQLREFSVFFGSKLSVFPKEEIARDKLKELFSHPFYIAEKQGVGPVGFIAGYLTPHFFNPEIIVLQELFWWVAEDHRGSKAGKLLLDRFLLEGKEYAHWITMVLEEKSPVNPECLTRIGFRPSERGFLMEVA